MSVESTAAGRQRKVELLAGAARQELVDQLGADLEQGVEIRHAFARAVVGGIDRKGGVRRQVELEVAQVQEQAAHDAALAELQKIAAIDGVRQRDAVPVVLARRRIVGQPAAAADRADLPQRLAPTRAPAARPPPPSRSAWAVPARMRRFVGRRRRGHQKNAAQKGEDVVRACPAARILARGKSLRHVSEIRAWRKTNPTAAAPAPRHGARGRRGRRRLAPGPAGDRAPPRGRGVAR